MEWDSLPTFGVVNNLPVSGMVDNLLRQDSLLVSGVVDNFLAWVGQDSLPAWVELDIRLVVDIVVDIVMDMAVDIETQCAPFPYNFSIVNYAR